MESRAWPAKPNLPAPLTVADLAPGDRIILTATVERIDDLGNVWIRWRPEPGMWSTGWLTNIELAYTSARKVVS